MEEHVGMIANNPNYRLEELEKLYDSKNYSSAHVPSPAKKIVTDDIRLNSVSAPATANPDEVLDRNSA
jgi:hypothetical protein